MGRRNKKPHAKKKPDVLQALDESRRTQLLESIDAANLADAQDWEWESLVQSARQDRDIETLTWLAEHVEKRIRKPARTALHALKSKGLEVPAIATPPAVTVRDSAMDRQSGRLCLTTPVDLDGSRQVFVTMPKLQCLLVMTKSGRRESKTMNPLSSADYAEMIQDFRQQAGEMLYPVPESYAIGLVLDAFRLVPFQEGSRADSEIYFGLLHLTDTTARHPAEHHFGSAPLRDAQSDMLADVFPFHSWQLPAPIREKLKLAAQSAIGPLFLPSHVENERRRETNRCQINEFVTKPWRRAIARRMRDNAYLRQLDGLPDEAARVLSVARLVEDAAIEPGNIEFFQWICSNGDVGTPAEPPSRGRPRSRDSLIIMP